MLGELVIVNFPRDAQVVLPTASTNLQWQTCLRRIAFLHRTELSLLRYLPEPAMHIYHGQQAYQFLLEVICGLHSPLLGETAVMGQFRTFRASAKFPQTMWGRFLRQLTTDALVAARQIRHQHLEGLGSQSYGSLVRKHLQSSKRIALLGTGSLANEIIPWLIDNAELRVFYRSHSHAQRLSQGYKLQLDQFTMADAGWGGNAGALVVAAPLSSDEITTWLELQSTRFSLILDLRSKAATDPINVSHPLVKLSELFASLCYQRRRMDQRKRIALRDIELIAGQRYPAAYQLCA